MTTLEIISRLCEVSSILSDIVKKQQETIERSKVEEAVKEELRQQVKEAERELDVIEYNSREYRNTGNEQRDLSVYEVEISASLMMEVEATGEQDAEERARQEYVNMTHISPKSVQAWKRGEMPSDD